MNNLVYKILFTLIVLCLQSTILKAQRTISGTNNSTLYLKIEDSKPRQYSTGWVLAYKGVLKKVYCYENYSYLRAELCFLCEDKSKVQQIPISTLGNYPLKTLEDLEAYFATLTSTQIESYIHGLKTIYIIEVFPNSSTAELAPVVLNVVIR
jgi:hypothetical protein